MTDDIFLTLSLLLSAALAARFIASVVPVPEILILVAVGALLGDSALDVIDVPLDSLGAQLLFTLGVSLILFYGGLSLSLPVLRRVWIGLGLLVVPGVVLTAAVVGLAAYLVFDIDWTAALLMGAVLAPTDPAILIPLFVRSRLRAKVAQTVIAESAFNDPTGAALALALAGVLLSGDGSLAHPAEDFLVDLLISTVIGVVAGIGLAAAISSHRSGIWRESSALAVLTVVTISFFSLDSAGGSGYLGAFLAGLIVGNMEHLGLAMHSRHEQEMRMFAFNLADLVTLFVFVVLGANIPFAALGENLLPSLAVLAALLLVARPLTVLACAMPDRAAGWTRQELTFLCWTRETGVVPAALVGVLAGLGVPDMELYASVVALAIIATLLLQALPAPWLAGRLGLLEPRTREVPTAAPSEAA
ncbi:MAG: potassium/hydrogen antiporter [Thermoleophilaceae bacterium]|jgi:cell volume regulation protein A|nr:potassium/hydrogen antiporter [Thermoleophilaceae bacterium]